MASTLLQAKLMGVSPFPCLVSRQVALSVVRFRTRYGSRQGVASNWLDRLAAPWAQNDEQPPSPVMVATFLRKSEWMRA